ncbi:MAG: hypothetical protein M1837_002656 [Sclerophora amabilis]|nr:MAG: hypothetical protein M1837_002656 [Sclerophora amabilis]
MATAVRPAPPSPTLTNPEMILPYGDDARSSTPSPPAQGEHCKASSPSPANDVSYTAAEPLTNSDNTSYPQPRIDDDVLPGDLSPAGTFGHGRPLSDIQEVETLYKEDRAEEAVRRRSRGQSPPLASSPTMANVPLYPKHIQRPVNATSQDLEISGTDMESNTMSLSDSEEEKPLTPINASGDEGDTEPDNFDASFTVSERLANDLRRMSNGTILEDEEDEDHTSSFVLSKRAETILANAKRRLDNMEGNLSRARTSLLTSPSPSPSPSISNSPHSPYHTPNSSADLNDRLSNHHLGSTPSKHRLLHMSAFKAAASPNHARVSSETSVPSSLYTSLIATRGGAGATRSASALGTARVTDSSYGSSSKGRILRRVQSNGKRTEAFLLEQPGTRNYFASNDYSSHASSPALAPPNVNIVEDEPGRGLGDKSASTTKTPFSSPIASASSNTSPNLGGLSRSRSTLQMRDVRDQVNDLKGRISSLKKRTKEDSLRRRSLQSLRTPSPFTAAEQWYTAVNGYKEGGLSANAGVGKVERWNETGIPFESEDVQEDEEEAIPNGGQSPLEEPAGDLDEPEVGQSESFMDLPEHERRGGVLGVSGGARENRLNDSDSGTEDFEEYEASVPPQSAESFASGVGERHEDRADAFDYENFYLHSGMGHYSQMDRDRRDSDESIDSLSSADSAETARGNDQSDLKLVENEGALVGEDFSVSANPYQAPSGHQRQNSTDSVSTVATFATAAEDRSVDASPSERRFDPIAEIRSTPLPTTPLQLLITGDKPADQDWLEARSDDGSNTPRQEAGDTTSYFPPPSRPTSAIKLTKSGPQSTTTTTTNQNPTTNGHFSSPRGGSTTPSKDTSPYLAPTSSSTSGSSCPGTPTPPTVQLSHEDHTLLERVLGSLRTVSLRLHEGTSEERRSENDGTPLMKEELAMLRKRLDDARRILNGERHGEVL